MPGLEKRSAAGNRRPVRVLDPRQTASDVSAKALSGVYEPTIPTSQVDDIGLHFRFLIMEFLQH